MTRPYPANAAPPGAGAAVIVFDGVCVLCNGWVRFLLRHDRRARYRFAAMQGAAGRGLLAAHGLDPDDPLSFLLIEHDVAGPRVIAHAAGNRVHAAPRVSRDSLAALRVLAGLGGAWRVVHLARLVPGALRDVLYRAIARNRYRWFGRHDACLLPDPASAWRFL